MDPRVERKARALDRTGARCWIEDRVPVDGRLLDNVVLCDPETLRQPADGLVNNGWAAVVRSGGERPHGIAPAGGDEDPPWYEDDGTPALAVGGVLLALGLLGVALGALDQ